MAEDKNIYPFDVKGAYIEIINRYAERYILSREAANDLLSKFAEKDEKEPQIFYDRLNDDKNLELFFERAGDDIVKWIKNSIINRTIMNNDQRNDLINKYLLALDKRNKTDKVIELIDYITCDDTFKYNNTVRNTCLAIANKYAKQDLMSDTTIINMISKFAEKDKKEAEIYCNKLNMLLDATNTVQFTREIDNDVVNWAKNNIINATIINNDRQNDLINKYLLRLDQMGKANKVIDLINYIAQDNTFEYDNTVNDLCIKIATKYNEKNLISDKKKNNIILKFTEKYSSAMREEISEESRVELSQEQKQVSNQQTSQKSNQETNQILSQITSQELTQQTNQRLGFDFEQDQESLFSK